MMATLTCIKSGLKFKCEHMPTAIAMAHPMFSVPQHKLISLAGKWGAQHLTEVESYLLFLALLDSTSLIQWRTHVQYTPATNASVQANMPALLSIIASINLINSPSFNLPSFAITQDTATLTNVKHWIEAWAENYADWQIGRQADKLRDKLRAREDALQRLLKSSTPPAAYAKMLATWAADAGSFPEFTISHPITATPITIREYWIQLITTIANDDKLFRFPRSDIAELITHCEDNIEHGNIYAHALMKYLRDGLRSYDDYLGFGEFTTPTTTFTVMSPTSSIHAINRAALINTAPTSEPLKHQYPTTTAWLKAYTKWKLSTS